MYCPKVSLSWDTISNSQMNCYDCFRRPSLSQQMLPPTSLNPTWRCIWHRIHLHGQRDLHPVSLLSTIHCWLHNSLATLNHNSVKYWTYCSLASRSNAYMWINGSPLVLFRSTFEHQSYTPLQQTVGHILILRLRRILWSSPDTNMKFSLNVRNGCTL